MGTLGGGNHFIELGESAKDGSHYLTIHSGSRHFGLKVCNYHAKKMHKTTVLPEEYHEEFKFITRNTLPTSDIPKKLEELNKRYHVGKKEYMLEKEDMYEYLVDMVIAQTYAQFTIKLWQKPYSKTWVKITKPWTRFTPCIISSTHRLDHPKRSHSSLSR